MVKRTVSSDPTVNDPSKTVPGLQDAFAKEGLGTGEETSEENGPLWKLMPDAKIPVSKSLGKLWQTRIQQGQAAKQDVETCWSEAIRYYENDQLKHRNVGAEGRAGNSRYARQLGNKWTETENVVFANATTMLPMLYAKNPTLSITPVNTEANQQFAATAQSLLNALFRINTAPGVNLKPRVRRGILWTLLTNAGYGKVGYTLKVNSSDQALEELQEISAKYGEEGLTQSEIKKLEGQLMALEEKVSMLNPQGPTFKLVSPYRLVIDPTAVEPDHSDAMWIAEFDFLQTDYLNAVYAQSKDGKNVSIYEPSHVLKPDTKQENGVQDDVNNFSLFKKDADQEAKNYGYQSTEQFKKSCYTKVWWIWDKTTRRLFLYADGKWEWPLWVWDDPLKLDSFFPYEHLWFHETVEGSQPKGEVTYYLDQQDAINDINSDKARARNWARMNVFYDKNKISQAAVEDVLRGPDGTARGIDVPENMKLQDVIFSFVPPATAHPEVFQQEIEQKFAAINRLTGINDAQRGAQFKTNTTNDAVDFYQKNVEIRMDEKIDAIEDWIGRIAWKLLQLCVQHMTQDDVAALIGQEAAAGWVQLPDPAELRSKLQLEIVGGSTEKPTSKNKQQKAVQMGQVLGQFSSGIPAIGLMVIKMFERAFKDDVVITNEDWDLLHQSMNQNMQKAGAGPGQGAPPEQGPGGEQVDPQQAQQLAQQIANLTPEAKQELQVLIKHGVPPSQALQKVTGAAQQAGPAPQPTK